MNNKFFIHTALIAVAGLTAASCIDENYDLSDVDLTLGVRGDISLPFCSTGDIILRNIMNLEEDGVVQFIDDPAGGDRIFAVRQSGRTVIPPIRIDDIRFDSPTITPFSTVVGLEFDRKETSKPQRISVVVIEDGEKKTYGVDIQDYAYIYPLGEKDDAYFSFDDVRATDISTDLVALEEVKLKENTIVAEIRNIDFGEADFFHHVHMDDATLTFPKDLHLTGVNMVYNGKSHPVPFDKTRGIITLFEGKGEAIDTSRPIKVEISFDGVTIGNDFTFTPGAEGGELKFDGGFRLLTTLRVESTEADEKMLQDAVDRLDSAELLAMLDPQTQRIKLNLLDADLIPEEVSVRGDGEFAHDLTVASVTGTVRREVDAPDPIMLDDLPDFLDDPEVVLDLSNPAIFLNVRNTLPGMATTALKLKGTQTRQTEEFEIVEGENRFELSDHYSTLRPEGYDDAAWLRVEDLGGLVRQLPEKIDVEVMPVTLRTDNMPVPSTYNVSLDYEIFAPLSCGPDFKLVYQDTERGWASDLEDLDNVDAGYIEVHALADNDLPASLTLDVIPVDEYGHTVEALEPIRLSLPASVSDHPLEMKVTPREGFTLNDVINGKHGAQRLDGVRYRAVIDEPVEDALLRETAKIKLHQIKATLKGGITVDAN